MIRPQRYFAWIVARRLFMSQLVVLAILLIIAGFSIRMQVFESVLATNDLHIGLAKFDSSLTKLLFTTFFLGAAMLFWVSIRQVKPLGRVLQRARELRRRDTHVHEDNSLDESDEPGEWYDLERAINRIHKDLRAQSEALSREREELSALIGAVSDAILAIDLEENPLFYNSQFGLLFRVAYGGQKALNLSEMIRVPEILQGYREVLRTGEMRLVTASVHVAHHPLPRHFSISIAPLNVKAGQRAEGAIGIFHDVTELKQSEQIRIEFVGNASHELRTPLTNIKGYVETLRADFRDGRYEDSSQFLDVISRNVDRLIFLVNDLLDLSTLESGAELAKTEVSTIEATEAALKLLENKRLSKKQTVTKKFDAEFVLADARRLEQVLVNLIHNAIKYIPEGREIQILWENSPQGTVLKVRDNGPGIPVEHQARLFERFYRVDPGRSREQGGTGLGLAIVKHIMIKHGGSIRIESRPGQGSEFISTFP